MYLIILIILFILIFFVWPIVKQRLPGKNGSVNGAGADASGADPAKKKISNRNGNRQDLTEFTSRLINFARKNKVRLIIPATFDYNDQEALISAMIVGHGKVTGIFCLGFGGSIEPDLNRDEWRQVLNGVEKYFKNPVKEAEGMDELVHTALKENGRYIPYKTVCVFTTPNVDITPLVRDTYTVDGFFYYLESADWVGTGDLDMEDVEKTMLSFIPMERLKKEQQERDQEMKRQQEQAKAQKKEARKKTKKSEG